MLHERDGVAAETREKVKKILKETSYSPNVMARVLKSRKGYHLVSLLPEPSEDNLFWEKHSTGINRAMEELELFNVILTQVTFDMFNEDDFQLKARSVINLRPDGVILAPIFKSESIAFCSGLKENGIPFVFVDGFIENTEFLAYIGEDIYRSGRVAGQLTDMITPVSGDILIVSIARNIQNVHHLNNRMNGFINFFERSGVNRGRRIKINIPNPSAESVSNALEKAFGENPAIGSVFMSGSKSYLIASCLEEKGLNSINLIGYDLLDRNVRYLKSGLIRFLLGSDLRSKPIKRSESCLNSFTSIKCRIALNICLLILSPRKMWTFLNSIKI